MEESKDTKGLSFWIPLLLLQLTMVPSFIGALYFWSKDNVEKGWYCMGLVYGVWIVSKLLTPKKVKEEDTNGPSSTD